MSSTDTLRNFFALQKILVAWIEVEYNNKTHSSTGETPYERWRNNIKKHPPRRITDIDAFNAPFLWRTEKTVDKYGKIRFQKNTYPIHGLPIGSNIELRYNPFDLTEVRVYHEEAFYCILSRTSRNPKVKISNHRFLKIASKSLFCKQILDLLKIFLL
ncbi:unnamed protein product [marine sediment metagenome]|uniref:Transposase-like Mu C-terminal domain-containing protein n=1 Tax=marine sediment metagenome TaxID=412755 RepID=X1F461_9ZZZZ